MKFANRVPFEPETAATHFHPSHALSTGKRLAMNQAGAENYLELEATWGVEDLEGGSVRTEDGGEEPATGFDRYAPFTTFRGESKFSKNGVDLFDKSVLEFLAYDVCENLDMLNCETDEDAEMKSGVETLMSLGGDQNVDNVMFLMATLIETIENSIRDGVSSFRNSFGCYVLHRCDNEDTRKEAEERREAKKFARELLKERRCDAPRREAVFRDAA